MNKTIVHFEIYGDNPPKLADFYKKLFGWNIEKTPGPLDYWFVKTVPTDDKGRPTEPGINGGMMKRPTPEARAWMNYIAVESIEDTVKQIQGLGGSVVMPKQAVPKLGWFAVVADPEMNVFSVWKDDPNAN